MTVAAHRSVAEPPMLNEFIRSAEILLVDDDPAILRLLGHLLGRAEIGRVTATTDVEEAMQVCLWREPDLILLDLHMPGMPGNEFLREVRPQLPEGDLLPVIVMTGDDSSRAMDAAFSAGARDFLRKPLEAHEVILRARNQLEIRFLNREFRSRNAQLEQKVLERTDRLKREQIETLERLARAAEYRDDDTGEHARRVGDLSARIADALGLGTEEVDLIWRAAMLHDVGKIAVSDTILLKKGRLTEEEMAIMRTHASAGAQILSGGHSAYMKIAERIALTHHERWDGSGYHGLEGTEIPLEGRIVAIADVFDALTHERPYKEAWPVDEAVALIESERGRQFDPDVVDAFLTVLQAAGVVGDAGREPEADESRVSDGMEVRSCPGPPVPTADLAH